MPGIPPRSSVEPKTAFATVIILSDAATGLLLKARLVNEKGDVSNSSRHDVTVNAKIDKDMVKPSWASVPRGLAGDRAAGGRVVLTTPDGRSQAAAWIRQDHGRIPDVARPSPIRWHTSDILMVGCRERVRRADDLDATQIGLTQAGGLNVFSTRNDASCDGAGRGAAAEVRQIAQSVSRR